MKISQRRWNLWDWPESGHAASMVNGKVKRDDRSSSQPTDVVDVKLTAAKAAVRRKKKSAMRHACGMYVCVYACDMVLVCN